MLSCISNALYLQAGITNSLPFKLVTVGLPVFVPLAVALLFAFWKNNRTRCQWRVSSTVRAISILVTFELGILGTLLWYSVKDDVINTTNSKRYKAAADEIQVGITKAEVIKLVGAPDNINQGKGGEELWWWQSHHRWEHPIAYRIIGKPAYEGGPYLQISFDESGHVMTVQSSSTYR